ncbi:MAG: Gfo/Idh/MocA family protein [Tumebacillaceae bacterium]
MEQALRKLRVGIIGTGFGAKVHVPMFNSHMGFEVVAVASVTARKNTEDIQAATGVEKVYTDWRAMIEAERLDVVSIVSAPPHHHEMAVFALEHGVHVLCEKPMAMDQGQSQEMLEARDKSGRLGFLNFEWRFLPARMKVKEVIAGGQLGRIMHVRYQGFRPTLKGLTTAKQGWLSQKAAGGGMLGAIGSHMFDSLLWWMGQEVASLQGQLSTYHPEVTDNEGNVEVRTSDQAFRSIGTLAGGTTFTVEYVAGLRNRKEDWKLEVYGTEGTLIMTDDQTVEVALGDEPFQKLELVAEKVAPAEMPSEVQRFYTPFISLVERMYDALAGKEIADDLPLFENGHHVQKIIDAIHESSESGHAIALKKK